ncbi:GTP pyrophosphokinase family protein [Streptomyces sp. CNZ748]|uniref:GTP pyrophosphokinase n=1 Tax=Streptomyces sp. CNZ748 TaxID=2885160 RepID=UPI001E52E02B|nr:hypothetical protein [Streptomyces sp. CNZ748]
MNLETMAVEYREKYQPKYAAYAERIKLLLQDLIEPTGIRVAFYESRVKTVGSFKDKIIRKKYQSPFSEMKDFAGVRVITYYRDDVTRIAEMISREFKVSPSDSGDKVDTLDVNQFGYRSLHLVCQMDSGRCQRSEWKAYADLYVEIQVRSVAEHAWALLSHELEYKSAASAPSNIQRRLFMLSALFEIADNEFQGLRSEYGRIEQEYASAIRDGDLSASLNSASLAAFFKFCTDLEEWAELGRYAGLGVPREYLGEFEATTAFLVEMFAQMGCRTLQDVKELLDDVKEVSDEALRKSLSASQHHQCPVYAYPLDVIMFAALAARGNSLSSGFKFPAAWGTREASMLEDLARGVAS